MASPVSGGPRLPRCFIQTATSRLHSPGATSPGPSRRVFANGIAGAGRHGAYQPDLDRTIGSPAASHALTPPRYQTTSP